MVRFFNGKAAFLCNYLVLDVCGVKLLELQKESLCK
jgi:hypothetical protein